MARCAACHQLFHKGGKIGPNLTAYQREDLGTMLTSILTPNAEIREGFENFTVTTKALLHQAIKQDEGQLCSFLDTDGTYSLLSNGYACLLFGTVDASHSFHLLGFTISMKEDKRAFSTALQEAKDAYLGFFDYVWNPFFYMQWLTLLVQFTMHY
jgi:hypothetical protein